MFLFGVFLFFVSTKQILEWIKKLETMLKFLRCLMGNPSGQHPADFPVSRSPGICWVRGGMLPWSPPGQSSLAWEDRALCPTPPTPPSSPGLPSPGASEKDTNFPLLCPFLECFKKERWWRISVHLTPLIVWKGESIHKSSLMPTWEAIPDCMQPAPGPQSLKSSPVSRVRVSDGNKEQEEGPLNV